ncbi:CRISPR-associated endonuclease Cas2 [Rosistilla oblonga]|uniref:CRISPR-associated endonuclease Cas2 n=1 Tax=Rosistilla oblonga TaxID=2527990 RepID=UPI003A96E2DF
MANPPTWSLVTYDVRDAKRLRKVAKLLEGYGERIQYSVFRVRLTREKLEKLRWELSEAMELEDDLLVIPLCERCASKVNEHSRGDRTDWGDPPATFEIL